MEICDAFVCDGINLYHTAVRRFLATNLTKAEGTWMTCPRCDPLDGILDIGYDLDRVRAAWRTRPLAERPPNQWRYAELLPLEPESVQHAWSVGCTPIIDSPRLARQLGIRQIMLKDEGRNPTASFKDRASSVGVSHALQVGCEDDRLRIDRQCREQPGGPRGAGWFAGVYLCAEDGAGTESGAIASVRSDRVRGEFLVR